MWPERRAAWTARCGGCAPRAGGAFGGGDRRLSRLLTDNLAILLALLALERVHAWSQTGSMRAFALACLWTGAAVLTRQSFLWLVPVALFFLVRGPAPPVVRAGGGVLLALALVPFAALVAEWNGLVPPSADPASCGLCTDRPGSGRDSLTLRTVGFSLALLAVYAVAALGPGALRRLKLLRSPAGRLARGALRSPAGQAARDLVARASGRRGPGLRQLPVAAALAGAVLLILSPLEYVPVRPGRAGNAGWLWRVSDALPTLLGSSLLFWVLVPLGATAGALLARRAGFGSLPSVYLGAFLLAALPVGLVYQKYFDPLMLLAVALYARPGDFRRPRDYAGIAVISVGSVAYALSFA